MFHVGERLIGETSQCQPLVRYSEAEPGKDLPLTIFIPFSSSALCQSKRSVCAFDDINTSLTVVADSETCRSAKPKVYRRYRV